MKTYQCICNATIYRLKYMRNNKGIYVIFFGPSFKVSAYEPYQQHLSNIWATLQLHHLR